MNNEERATYFSQINDAQNKFYKQTPKNNIFKRAQKINCAEYVVSEMNLEKMIECAIFIIPNTNIIFYNYLVLKTFANQTVHLLLYEYTLHLIQEILKKYQSFEFHANLKSFTISAFQRYFTVITTFLDDSTEEISSKMSKIVIYNTPKVIDQMTMLLMKTVNNIGGKITFHREESDTIIDGLLTATNKKHDATKV